MLTFQTPQQVKIKILFITEIKRDSKEAQQSESIQQNTKKEISNI